jgi:DNA topoisomerase-3
MSKTLILTEKPSVAREFAQALSTGKSSPSGSEGFIELENYVITWAIGHLLTPFDPEDYDFKYKKWSLSTLPIIPSEFKFKALPKTKKQLEIIKRIIKRSDLQDLIVATDAGREGELIARLILLEANSKLKAYRFWTSAALTKNVIQEQLTKLRPLDDYNRLFLAGSVRQKADWIVGMNLSRLATIKLGDLFSVGRVQTAVLGLLVDRRSAIDQFEPADYFELKAKFKFNNGVIEAYWFDPKKKEDEKRQDRRDFFDLLNEKLKKQQAVVSVLNQTEKTQYPQGLYSLTELQRQANILYGFSANKTLEIAQSLYEKYKCLSYPRTDSKVMASSSLDLVKGLVFRFKELYPERFEKFETYKVSLKNKSVFDDSKLTDHHGLIPLKDFSGSPSSNEGKIFHLVLNRFIANFLANHIFLETEIQIDCQGEKFKAQGKKILEIGYKILDGKESESLLPEIKLGESGTFQIGETEAKKTKPPHEYTEASLLYDMTNPARLVEESDLKKVFRTEIGLGTQATRAQIIETLLKRSYIERNGKNLKATSKGVELINRLKQLPSTKLLTSVSQTAKLEILLQEMADGESNGADVVGSIENYVINATKEWTGIESLPKVAREGKFSKFQKSRLQLGKCPKCEGEIIDFPKSFSCSRWKEGCGFTIWKYVAKKKLSESQVKSLVQNGKTSIIKGFKSKAGKNFDATLILNKEGKVEFQFEVKSN